MAHGPTGLDEQAVDVFLALSSGVGMSAWINPYQTVNWRNFTRFGGEKTRTI
jgi:hypothetical protein